MGSASVDSHPRITSSKPQRQLELADIFRQHGQAFLATRQVPLRSSRLRVMRKIVNCRTEVLGGHRHWCARCNYQRFLYHSCRDRHCPKCQTTAKEAWREARQLELLPVPYFHNVFTLPHELNALILRSESNQRHLLKLLFDAAAQTLLEFSRSELGGQGGFTMVLHTWDQQLRPHFHLHCLMASGALALDRCQWIAGGSQFLFPVRALSKMYRGKFLAGLRKLLDASALDEVESIGSPVKRRQLLRCLNRKSWVVYSKAPFASPAKLLDYLSRYTHRVALTNSRLKRCENGEVTFTYRDRRDGDRRKQMSLPVNQFIGRFLTHVLPPRFMRIRHYGFMANRHRKQNIATIRKLLGAREPMPNTDLSPLAQWIEDVREAASKGCPCCGEALYASELPNRLSSGPASANPTPLESPVWQPKRGPP